MIGGVSVGGGSPVRIQSMTNTRTEDAEATIRQILSLEEAGCERIFPVDSVTGRGIDELREYLLEEKQPLDLDRVMENQRKGLKDWA